MDELAYYPISPLELAHVSRIRGETDANYKMHVAFAKDIKRYMELNNMTIERTALILDMPVHHIRQYFELLI